jgi:glycosyltransferase involved in cell wall biosynthesis
VSTTRVSLLTEIPAPFRIPLFNALARDASVELRVLFLGDHDPKRPYPIYAEEFAFSWRVFRHLDVVVRGRWLALDAGVLVELVRRRPDVLVLGGWNQPAFWQASLWARATRTPMVLWVESTARDARPGSAMLERAKRALIRQASAFLVPGRASAEYVAQFGVAPDRIVVAPNAVDLSIFGRPYERDDVRRKLGLERTTILCVARLDPEKGIDLLLEAAVGLDADILIAGRGAQEQALRAQAPPNVRFVGRVDRDELARWYAAADAFVLPSRSEQWGMVVNEAAAAGLPLVVSDAAGAAYDLVDDGVNGIRVPAGDAKALRAALSQVVDDPTWRLSARSRSLELAARHTPEAWAGAVSELAKRLVKR